MQLTRNEARVKAMLILYQVILMDKNKIDYNIDDIIKETMEVKNDFTMELVNGVIKNAHELEQVANKYLDSWSLDRLAIPDQAIIKIAIYELLYTDTTGVIVINEAIELAKKYSDDKVVKMINGILDKIYHDGKLNSDEK